MMIELPDEIADRLARLTPEEKEQLRALTTQPLFRKFLSIAESARPSASPLNPADRHFGQDRAEARLGEMRGWDMHRAALSVLLAEPKAPISEPDHTFPDEGRMLPEGATPPADPPPKRRRR